MVNAVSQWDSHYVGFIPTNKKWYQFWKPKHYRQWLHYSRWPQYVHPEIAKQLEDKS